ncbi:OmpA family protein [Tepidamorphus sp. 3E244]|uniref:OmpA family protein n=1 Tax=Tepidamorphus sp. 3E244 TaxID=3385498 RepID=UPI0038FCE88A
MALIALLALYIKPVPIQTDLSNRSSIVLSSVGHEWADASADGRDITLNGTAPSEDAQAAAREMVAEIWGVRSVTDQSSLLALADPFILTITRDDDAIILAGNVPSQKEGEALAQVASDALPQVRVDTSNLTAARGVPDLDAWQAMARNGIGHVSLLRWGTAGLTGLDYTIEGEARSPAAYEDLFDSLKTLPDGVRLAGNELLPPIESPHLWSASYDGSTLTLDGLAPDFDARDRMRTFARNRLPGAEVASNVQIARGGLASEQWLAAVDFVFLQFSRLDNPEARLSGGDLTLSGSAASIENYESVLAALSRNLPAGVSVSRADISPPPSDAFSWIARMGPDGLTVEGYVPDSQTFDAISEVARAAADSVPVRVDMRVADAPDGATPQLWLAGATYVLNAVRHFGDGEGIMVPGRIAIDGTARTSESFDRLSGQVADVPDGFTLARREFLPPEAESFTWSAKIAANAVILDGFAPSADSRNRLVGVFTDARPGLEVQSTVGVARGPVSEEQYDGTINLAASILTLLNQGQAALDESIFSVRGVARDVDAFAAANALVNRLPDGVELGSVEILPAAIGVLTWTATHDGGRLVLDGFIPDETSRDRILTQISDAKADAEVTDRMQIATGGEEAVVWEDATRFALTQLLRLTRGQARLAGTELSIQGEAEDFDTYDVVTGELTASLPTGLQLGQVTILPPSVSPYVWGAERGAKTLALTGNVPSEEVRREITAFARERFSGLTVEDEMRAASGAPGGMVQAVGVGFAALGKLTSGTVKLTDRSVSLEGVAAFSELKDEAATLVTDKLPAGYTGTTRVEVTNPDVGGQDASEGEPDTASTCQTHLDAAMEGNSVRFEVGSTDVSASSFELLDQVAAIIQACSGLAIEVGGHTDSDGPDDFNLTLSQQRAQSVVKYLIGKGVSEARLRARGYGEERPVASNENEAGKARNRRIAFTIIG